MATYIAFLRAINLGAIRKFGKADIVAATEAAGCTDVATHINTGNVRFVTTLRSRVKIEVTLERAYLADRGFEVPTIVFTPQELQVIAEDADRFGGDSESRHYVSLLKQPPSDTAAKMLEAASTPGEVARVRGRAVHLLIDGSYHEAKLTNALVEKHLGVATNRNLTVIRALVTKWC
ncbi:MAG: DUF1697 domain-containing protein [Nocardioidaceae bacterium]